MVFLSKICGKTYCIILYDLYSMPIGKVKNWFPVLYSMVDAKLLQQVRSSEKSGRVARRLDMLIVLLNMKSIFTMAAATYSCDRRTIVLWHGRMSWNTGTFDDIRGA